jgi:hypothetical protein
MNEFWYDGADTVAWNSRKLNQKNHRQFLLYPVHSIIYSLLVSICQVVYSFQN